MPNEGQLNNLKIHLDEETRKVIATFTPEEGTTAITSAELRQAIDAAGFGGYDLYPQAMDNATQKYNAGKAFEIVVGMALDGKFSLRIDPHGMSALLTCSLALGGTAVQLQNILEDAEKRGITASLDLKAIERALREGGKDILIATGRSPVNGVDGRFESLVPSMKTRTPHLDEHGLADFRDLGDVITVHVGDALIRRILPTNGEPGETVTGKVIPVKPGKNVSFSSKQNGATIDPADPDLLIAAISGCPVVTKDGATVEPVYTIKDVDLHIGNVNYDGTVHVTGDVLTGMSVKATGDIYVDGTVESATLEAGGDIVVKGGIIGGSEQHEQAVNKPDVAIQCKGSCTARFVQHTHITAGNGIFIHDVALLSELTAAQVIIVGDPGSRKGDIIGGIARATMLVKAKNIGSSANIKTEVIVGADKALHEAQDNTRKNLEATETRLASILKLLEIAHAKPDFIPQEKVSAAEEMRDPLAAEIENLKQEEIELQKEIDLAHGAKVEVEKRIFGGTQVIMGLQHYNVTLDKEGGVFCLNEEHKLILT